MKCDFKQEQFYHGTDLIINRQSLNPIAPDTKVDILKLVSHCIYTNCNDLATSYNTLQLPIRVMEEVDEYNYDNNLSADHYLVGYCKYGKIDDGGSEGRKHYDKCFTQEMLQDEHINKAWDIKKAVKLNRKIVTCDNDATFFITYSTGFHVSSRIRCDEHSQGKKRLKTALKQEGYSLAVIEGSVNIKMHFLLK